MPIVVVLVATLMAGCAGGGYQWSAGMPDKEPEQCYEINARWHNFYYNRENQRKGLVGIEHGIQWKTELLENWCSISNDVEGFGRYWDPVDEKYWMVPEELQRRRYPWR